MLYAAFMSCTTNAVWSQDPVLYTALIHEPHSSYSCYLAVMVYEGHAKHGRAGGIRPTLLTSVLQVYKGFCEDLEENEDHNIGPKVILNLYPFIYNISIIEV